METRIRKWGNSLALRIPQTLARQLDLQPNSQVRLAIRGKSLAVQPMRRPPVRLDALLDGVTESNRHGEVDTGRPTGREIW